MKRFFGFLFIVALVAAAFYGGMRYREIRQFLGFAVPAAEPPASPTPTPDAQAAFNSKRATVDTDPQKWLAEHVAAGSKPFDSKDPEFLYLYGRALMLTGNHNDAIQAFDLAIANYQNTSATPLPPNVEAKLARAAAALKTPQMPGAPPEFGGQKAAAILDELLGLKGQPVQK